MNNFEPEDAKLESEFVSLLIPSSRNVFSVGRHQKRNECQKRNRCWYLSLPRTIMLNNFPKSKTDVELFVIKFVADLRKSGKDSTTVDLL
jgi:hypothetical protein